MPTQFLAMQFRLLTFFGPQIISTPGCLGVTIPLYSFVLGSLVTGTPTRRPDHSLFGLMLCPDETKGCISDVVTRVCATWCPGAPAVLGYNGVSEWKRNCGVLCSILLSWPCLAMHPHRARPCCPMRQHRPTVEYYLHQHIFPALQTHLHRGQRNSRH